MKENKEESLIKEIKIRIDSFKEQLTWPVHRNKDGAQMCINVLEGLIKDKLDEKGTRDN